MKPYISSLTPDITTADKALGTHILLELSQCPGELLLEKEQLCQTLVESAKKAGAQVKKTVFHHFSPHGLSGVVLIAESHITVHTWPEHEYAAIDIFTCGDPQIARRIQTEITERFSPATTNVREFSRGPIVNPEVFSKAEQ